jgi:hypothetical protein
MRGSPISTLGADLRDEALLFVPYPSTLGYPREAPMPFRRFPVQCAVTYNAGWFQDHGSVWNVSCTG